MFRRFPRYGLLATRTSRNRKVFFEHLEGRNLLATLIWDGGGADNNWMTAANWSTDVAPSNNDALIFPSGAARLSNTNNFVNATFASITFGGASYDLQGNSLTLTGGVTQNVGANNNNVTLDITLGGSQSFTNNASGLLWVNKSIQLNGHSLTLDGTGQINLNSFSGSNISGTGNLIRGGTGSTILINTASNTFVGSTTVQAGATLSVTSGITTAVSIPGTLNILGTFNLGRNNSVASTSAVNVTGGTLNVSTFTNTIASLEMTGGQVTSTSGTLTLGGPLTSHAAATTATINGNLSLGGGDRTITVADGAAENDLDIAAVISSGGLFKAGAGRLRFSGAGANTYTGLTRVNEGSLLLEKSGVTAVAGDLHVGDGSGGALADVVTYGASNSVAVTSDVVVNSSGLFSVGNFAGEVDELTVAGKAVKSGFGALVVNTLTMQGGIVETGSAALRVLNAIVASPAATATITGNLDLDGGTRIISVGDGAGATDLVISAVIDNGSIDKFGTGTLQLTAANTYAGATTVSSGVLNISNAAALGTTAGGTVVAAGAALEVQGNITVVDEPLTANAHGVGGNGALRGRSGTNEWQGPIDLGASGSVGADAGSVLVVSRAISGSSFAKWGSGRVDLTAANNFSGNFDVIGGTARISHASALGTTAGGTTVQGAATLELVGDIAISGESLTIYNSSAAIRNVSGNNSITGAILVGSSTTISVVGGVLDISSPINNNGNLLTLSVEALGADAAILRGTITGSGGLWKSGPGELAVHAANTYAGVTTIHEGRLTLYGNGTLGNATQGTVINADGTLRIVTNTPVTENLTAIGSGLNDDGAIRGVDGAVLAGNVVITGTTAVRASGGVFTVSGNISETGSFRTLVADSLNSGLLVFSGANTYTGNTRIIGDVRIDSSTAVPVTSKVEMSSGVLIVNDPTVMLAAIYGTGDVQLGNNNLFVGSSNTNETLFGSFSGSGGLVKVGAGEQTLSGTHTYLGQTLVNAGKLILQTVLADGASANDIVVAAGATFSGPLQTAGTFDIQTAGSLVGDDIVAGGVHLATGALLHIGATESLTVTGAMSLDDAILDLQVSGPVSAGTHLKIIDMAGTEPVFGSFRDLAEGTVFTVGTDTFQIAYQGGDGNDVELVALDLSGITLSLNASAQTVAESVGVIQVTAQLSAAATADLVFPVVFTGTANNGTDYSVLQGTFTFLAGATTATIEIEVLEELRFEGVESIVATIQPANGVTAGAFVVHTIDITDNDVAPSISFSTPSQEATEGTIVNVEVQLSAETDLPVTVQLLITGSATVGDDYLVATSIVVPPGQRTASVPLSVIDETLGESSELAIIEMGALTNATASTSPDAPLTQVISIPQNDAPSVSFVGALRTLGEGSGLTSIQVELSNPAATDIVVPFSLSGTLLGSEYTVSPNSPHDVIIPAGQTVGTISVTLLNDSLDEPTETLVLRLGTPVDAIVGASNSFTLQVLDDDVVRVSFTNASATAFENIGSMSYTVTLSNPSTSTISVPITVSGTGRVTASIADEGADFTTPLANIVFTPGVTSVTRVVSIANDTITESTEELVIGLKKPSNAELGSTTNRKFYIKDNDPLATIKGSVDSVTEGNTSVNFKVSLSAATNVDVVVPFKLSGSATRGKDYNVDITPPSVTIPAGQTSATIAVGILEDSIDEDTQDLRVTITEPAGQAKLGAITSDAISIKDDDAAPGIRFDTPSSQLSASEAGVTRTITVELTKVSGRDVTVGFNFSGSAGRNSDYTVSGLDSSNRLVIKAGQTSGSFKIKTKDDSTYEGNESIAIALGTVTNATKPTKSADLSKKFSVQDNDAKPTPYTCITSPAPPPSNLPAGTVVLGDYGTVTTCGYFDFSPIKVDASTAILSGSNVSNDILLFPSGSLAIATGMQGSLVGTTAFFDANFNGVVDFLDLDGDGAQSEGEPSEPFAATELDGSFGIIVSDEFDRDASGLIEATEGRWVLAGGVDASTGLPWTTRMSSPVGVYTITPLTTLAENLVRLEGLTVAESLTRVAEAFDLGEVNLATLSPLEGLAAGDAASARVYAAHVQIYSSVIQIAELYSGAAPSLPIAYLADVVYSDIAAKITTEGSEIDLSIASIVESVISGVGSATGIALPADQIEGAASIIAAGNQAVDAVPQTADAAYAVEVVKVKHVLQEDAALALREVGNGTRAIADVVAEFTGANLQSKIAVSTAIIVIPPVLIVDNVNVTEGHDGQRVLEFTVSLNGDHSETVAVDYATQDGAATVADGDYDSVNGTLQWLAGDNFSRTIQVVVHGDATFEADEDLGLVLTNNVNAVIRVQRGVGYILNDDSLSFDAIVNLGGANNFEALLNSTQAFIYQNGSPLVEGYQTAALNATFQGQDNQSDTLTLDFTANSFRSDVISFHGGNGAGIDTAVIRGGRFSAITQVLTNATDGQTIFTPVESATEVTFNWFGLEPFLLDVDETADLEFVLPAGVTDAILEDADLNDDVLAGMMQLRSPSNAFETTIFANPTGVLKIRGGAVPITIGTLDPAFTGELQIAPTTSGIADVAVNEDASPAIINLFAAFGDADSSDGDLTFTVTPAGLGATTFIDDGPAAPGNLIIEYPGNVSGSMVLTIRATDTDGLFAESTFTLTIEPVNDPPSGGDKTVIAVENSFYTFTAADFGFSDPADTPADDLLAVKIITLPAAGSLTVNGSAVGQNDFVLASDIAAGALRFTPTADTNGSAYANFTFQVQDDGGTLRGGIDLDATANVITIDVTPDNQAPVIENQSFSSDENRAMGALVATVVANDPDNGDTLTYAIISGNTGAAFAIDNNGNITVNTASALDYETNPSFTLTVRVTDQSNDSDTATVTITLNDLQSTLSIADLAVTEGDHGTTQLVFIATLSGISNKAFTVDATTSNGTASDGALGTDTDYSAVASTLSFTAAALTETQQVIVVVTADSKVESHETLSAILSNLVGSNDVTIVDGTAIGTISNDDSATLAIDDVTQSETNGATTFVFTVTLSAAVDTVITIDYQTANGSATISNADYAAANGTLTFVANTAGAQTQQIQVTVNGDDFLEPNETFFVDLFNLIASGRSVNIVDAQGQATIQNDGDQILRFEAETDLFHLVGRADGDAWSASVAQDSAGFMNYGPYTNKVAAGQYTATYRLMVGSAAAPHLNVATIDVFEARSGRVLASRNVRRGDFTADNVYQDFVLPFEVSVGNALLEFRTQWHDIANLRQDYVQVVPRVDAQLVFEAETDFYHQLGRADGDGWKASVNLDATGFLAYGPYTTQVAQGFYTASFRLMVDGDAASSLNVATIDVYDVRSNKMLAARNIRRGDFAAANVYQDFNLEFDVSVDNALLEFRTFWYDVADVKEDAVRISPREVQQLIFEAESDFYHQLGRASGNTWSASVALDPSGYMNYGPYTSLVDQGLQTATFRLAVGGNVANSAVVATIDVWDAHSGRALATRNITRGSFSSSNTLQDFDLPFEVTTDNTLLEFRTFFYDVADLSQDWVRVMPRTLLNLKFEAETDLYHQVGRILGASWSANTTQDNAGYLAYGPYTSLVGAGTHDATFRLLTSSNVGSSTPVVTIDVWDARSNQSLARREIRRSNFSSLNTFQDFELIFDVPGNDSLLEFRTFWHDRANAQLDWVTIDRDEAIDGLFEE